MASLSISEFARECGLAVSALRFYDRCGLLRPADVDPSTGYRSYDQVQLTDAALLRDLRRVGLSIDEIKAFHDTSPAAQRALVADRLTQLQAQLSEARTAAEAVLARIQPEETTVMTNTTVHSKTLKNAIDQVAAAVDRTQDAGALGCVLVESRDGSLRLVATDRFRLAVRDLAIDLGEGVAAQIPASELEQLRTVLPADLPVQLTADQLTVSASWDGGAHTLTGQPSQFPPYEQLLDAATASHTARVLRNDLLGALDGPTILRVRFDTDRLTLTGDDEHAAVIDADYQGPAMTIGLNGSYLRDAAEHAVGPDLLIEFSAPTHPVVVRSADDGTYTCMIMPVWLEDADAA